MKKFLASIYLSSEEIDFKQNDENVKNTRAQMESNTADEELQERNRTKRFKKSL